MKSSIGVILLGLIGGIVTWNSIINTNYLDYWYPKIGALVATHGAFFGGSFWAYLSYHKRSVREQWRRWFKKD